MDIEFITYKELPSELLERRNQAFINGKLTPECQALDDSGEYTALYMNKHFMGAANIICNQENIDLWSKELKSSLKENYGFFCTGFKGDIARGMGKYILGILLMDIILKSKDYTYYTSVRPFRKSLIATFEDCGFKQVGTFFSHSQVDKVVDLELLQFAETHQFAEEKKAELIAYIQQKVLELAR